MNPQVFALIEDFAFIIFMHHFYLLSAHDIAGICNATCIHGDCVAPNVCKCDAGWEGTNCDRGQSLIYGYSIKMDNFGNF